MNRQHTIKVFKPNDKRCDFTIRSVTAKGGVDRLASELGPNEAKRVQSAFRSLKALGGETMSFRTEDGSRKVRVAVPIAA